MRINSIDIRNFRCYERMKFDFDKRLSVVVGNNTAGKTALLHAVQVALGAYLQCLKSVPSDKNYRCNFQENDIYKRYNEEKKDFFRNDERTGIKVDAEFVDTLTDERGKSSYVSIPLSWWREYTGSSTTHSVSCVGELIEHVGKMEALRKSDGATNAVYPVILSFGANRLDNQYRTAQKTKERSSRIEKAYKAALSDATDFKSAFDWLYRYENNIKMGTEFEGTMEAFVKALTTAIPALSDIMVDVKNCELFAKVSVTGQKPQYQAYQFMSDGFKSVINIVSEIAYRSILLNGHLGKDAIINTPGVVLIDEVELYLHPRWQRHYLNELIAAFPKIQFIITSHSPFIIQSVKKENLITLDGINDETDPIYRSIEEIAEKEMNMDNVKRSRKYQEMLELAERYFKAVAGMNDLDPEEQAALKRQLDAIEEEYSENPAYVALLQYQRSKKEFANETRQ